MYNAPAVSFPVARSLFAACALAVIWLVGATACFRLATMPSQPEWLPWAATALCLGVGLAALGHWRATPRGVLVWDRRQWSFAPPGLGTVAPEMLNDVSVHLDFQSVMLVSFRRPNGQRLWVWLENLSRQRPSGRLWRTLRRALFARPKDKTDGLGLSVKRAENLSA